LEKEKTVPLMSTKISLGLLTACFLVFLSATTFAQSPDANSRQSAIAFKSDGSEVLETESLMPNSVEERRPRVFATAPVISRFDQLLLGAIQTRLGSSYHYGSTGPNTFDCSGFVWRTFQEAGAGFTRGPARSYWATMPAATKDEQSKFGTLVFFSGLAHVGIVADGKGFYHASRHHGVIYSPFNDYWLARIDGFRRIPMSELRLPAQIEKSVTSKGPQRGTNIIDSSLGNH